MLGGVQVQKAGILHDVQIPGSAFIANIIDIDLQHFQAPFPDDESEFFFIAGVYHKLKRLSLSCQDNFGLFGAEIRRFRRNCLP